MEAASSSELLVNFYHLHGITPQHWKWFIRAISYSNIKRYRVLKFDSQEHKSFHFLAQLQEIVLGI
jgi:hypothetical protein